MSTGPEPTPAQLEGLEVCVQSQLAGRVRNVRLLFQEGGLVLQGQATTYYAKQLAQHIVLNSSPLPLIRNEIEVVGDARRPPDAGPNQGNAPPG